MIRAPEEDETTTALLRLLTLLKQRDYAFITPTPATHARVLARPDRQEARSLEDVLGWSLRFGQGLLPPDIEACLEDAHMLRPSGSDRRSLVRVSSLAGHLYLHSSFPTTEENSVFFGPDSYRFAALVARELKMHPPPYDARIVDIGCGTGVGAITTAMLCPSASVVMTDVNGAALRFASCNATSAGVDIQAVETSGLETAEGSFDIATINPPYIIDDSRRMYRNGGDMRGAELSVKLAAQALERLRPGGRIILYTGSAIVRGHDALRETLAASAHAAGATLSYQEADPDVFGEELGRAEYCDVDRIALINCIIAKHQAGSQDAVRSITKALRELSATTGVVKRLK